MIESPLVRIVDDDIELLSSLEFMLTCEGYEVAAYSSAAEFLVQDTPSRIGCLLLDIAMPAITGLELQGILNNRQNRIPIIFLTAHGDIDIAVQTMKDGAFDFQQKPIRTESLLQSIAKAIEWDRSRRGGATNIQDEIVRFNSLTDREKAICREVAMGYINKQIGERLGISKRTVDHHRASALNKLGIRGVAELAMFLQRMDKVLNL